MAEQRRLQSFVASFAQTVLDVFLTVLWVIGPVQCLIGLLEMLAGDVPLGVGLIIGGAAMFLAAIVGFRVIRLLSDRKHRLQDQVRGFDVKPVAPMPVLPADEERG